MKKDWVERPHAAVRDRDALRAIGRAHTAQETVLPPQQFQALNDDGAFEQLLFKHGLAKDVAEPLLTRLSVLRARMSRTFCSVSSRREKWRCQAGGAGGREECSASGLLFHGWADDQRFSGFPKSRAGSF